MRQGRTQNVGQLNIPGEYISKKVQHTVWQAWAAERMGNARWSITTIITSIGMAVQDWALPYYSLTMKRREGLATNPLQVISTRLVSAMKAGFPGQSRYSGNNCATTVEAIVGSRQVLLQGPSAATAASYTGWPLHCMLSLIQLSSPKLVHALTGVITAGNAFWGCLKKIGVGKIFWCYFNLKENCCLFPHLFPFSWRAQWHPSPPHPRRPSNRGGVGAGVPAR